MNCHNIEFPFATVTEGSLIFSTLKVTGCCLITISRCADRADRAERAERSDSARYTAVRRQNTLIHFFFKYFITILYQNISVEKLLHSIFCDQTLYISNVCSHITEVALLNNFRSKN